MHNASLAKLCALTTLVVCFFGQIAANADASVPRYTITELGTLGGRYIHASAMNNRGQIVGESSTPDWKRHAFLWDHGKIINLDPLSKTDSTANDINEEGQIVGQTTSHDGQTHPVLWQDRKVHDLGIPGCNSGNALAITDTGSVVVNYRCPPSYRSANFVWTAKLGLRKIPFDSVWGILSTMNSCGEFFTIVSSHGMLHGELRNIDDINFPVHNRIELLKTDKVMPSPMLVNRLRHAVASDVDNKAEYPTSMKLRYYLWTHNALTEIGTPTDHIAYPKSINDHDQIVGSAIAVDPSDPQDRRGERKEHGFLWEQNHLYDLNSLVPKVEGRNLSIAWLINNNGKIVASGWKNGIESTYLLTPVPQPSFQTMRQNPLSHRARPHGTGVITGRVVYEDGRPASNIAVLATMQSDAFTSLQMPSWGRMRDKQGHSIGLIINGMLPSYIERVQSATALTAADGTYRLVGLTDAPYDIWVAPKGSRVWSMIQKPWEWVAAADEGVAASEDKTVTAPDLLLTHGVLIQGQVLDQTTGKPLPRIVVTCHGPTRPATSNASLNTITDAEGKFSLRTILGWNSVGLLGRMLDDIASSKTDADPIEIALWSFANDYTVTVDAGALQQKKLPGAFTSLEVRLGRTQNVIFRLKRANLQHRYKTSSQFGG